MRMEENKVPPNWSKLVQKASEQVIDEDYDLAKTWLFPDANPGDIAMQTNSSTTSISAGISNYVPTVVSNNVTSAL